MNRIFAFAFLVFALLGACDFNQEDPWYLDLEGHYTGTVTFSSPGLESFDGTITVTVIQSGNQVTLSGNMQLLGESHTLAAFTGTVSETGFFTLTDGGYQGTLEDPECGPVIGGSTSIQFFENGRLEMVENFNFQVCGTISAHSVLRRS